MVIVVLVMLALMLPAGPVQAAGTTYYAATTGSDATSCSGNSQANPFATIGRALQCAQGGDTIQIAAGTYQAGPSGGLLIASSVALHGAGAGQTIVTGSGVLVTVYVTATTTIEGLTISGGGGAGKQYGAITNGGTLTLLNTAISGNTSGNEGGAIFNAGTLIVKSSAFNGNGAYDGGAIFNDGGSVSVAGSTFSGNSSSTDGGAIDNYTGGPVTVTDSTFIDNSASYYGGALANGDGPLTLTNSTFGGNSAYGGGAIFNNSIQRSLPVTLVNSTVSGNSATQGGGVFTGTGAVMSNTVLAKNTFAAGGWGADCAGGFSDGPGGHNLVGNGQWFLNGATYACGLTNGANGDRVGTNAASIDPELGPIASNGGPTQTMALLAVSPAIGAGNAATCEALVGPDGTTTDTDQRGDPRNSAARGACDVGAYDTGGVVATGTTLASSTPNTTSTYGQGVTFTATVAPTSGTGTPTGTVDFYLGGTTKLGSGTLAVVGGQEQASFSTSALPAGSDSITASYGGGGVFAPSSSAVLTQAVQRAQTTTGLAASANPAVFGQPVAFTATVAAQIPSTATPTGAVQFAVDGTNLGNPVALAGGTATSPSISGLAAGNHTVAAAYTPDNADFVASDGSLQGGQQVNRAQTTTGLAASPDPAASGQSVTLTATVAAMAPGAGPPTGTVTFLADGVALGSAPLGQGSPDAAVLTTSGLPVGGHQLTASYGGDAGFLGSTSNSLTENVDTNLGGQTSLQNASLKGAYLVQADLANANLSSSNLSGANLSGATLSGADLAQANLSAADLAGADLSGAKLAQANLKGADLTRADLRGATGLGSANLGGVVWAQTTCPDGSTSDQDGGTCAGH